MSCEFDEWLVEERDREREARKGERTREGESEKGFVTWPRDPHDMARGREQSVMKRNVFFILFYLVCSVSK